MHKLTISIVNFNTGAFIVNCLESLEKVKEEAKLSIFVVDNASKKGDLEEAKEKFPSVGFIENNRNLGFGKANNQVLKKLKTEYVLILNPDCLVSKGTIKYMLSYMDQNQDVGAASCKLVKSDGKIDWASHRGFPTPWASFKYYFLGDDSLYHLTGRDFEKAHEVDSISGAFFLTRKSVLLKVGLFDEDYFMYAEDIDLCFRIKEAGFKIMYIPQVSTIHLKGVSSGIKSHTREISPSSEQSKLMAFNSFYSTMALFYKKNLADKYPLFINWIVYLGINLKWALAKRKMVV